MLPINRSLPFDPPVEICIDLSISLCLSLSLSRSSRKQEPHRNPKKPKIALFAPSFSPPSPSSRPSISRFSLVSLVPPLGVLPSPSPFPALSSLGPALNPNPSRPLSCRPSPPPFSASPSRHPRSLSFSPAAVHPAYAGPLRSVPHSAMAEGGREREQMIW
ncbi:hypothetical protein Scep_020413 [Stephania cephalantha]|uniref:Uncharacterized protein n=1 Tax=Stephania cephalantha TaxID=152367 RepID=A0AAP0ICK2_9MAGN